jgi:hypothetical protein
VPAEAFFVADGEPAPGEAGSSRPGAAHSGSSRAERFIATELTRGPWSPDHQHAGPPAALLGRAVERLDGGGTGGGGRERQVGRITFEILRPIPIAPLTVEAQIVRPGRSVDLAEATLRDDSGQPLVRARAWRIETAPAELAPEPTETDPPPPGPDAGSPRPFFPTGAEHGYHTAMETRFVRGAYLEPGPATVWFRMRVPLVAGETPSPLERLLTAADSGNGVSATHDPRTHVFINTDLTVHLFRQPHGEWVCLDAITLAAPAGLGLSDTALHDEQGRIGRAAQTLLVRRR